MVSFSATFPVSRETLNSNLDRKCRYLFPQVLEVTNGMISKTMSFDPTKI